MAPEASPPCLCLSSRDRVQVQNLGSCLRLCPPDRNASLPASQISRAFISGASLKGTVSEGICGQHRRRGHTHVRARAQQVSGAAAGGAL